MVRTALRLVIDRREGLMVVGEAGDGEQAVARAAELRPDVVLMDIRMPGTTGVEATRRITGCWPGPGPAPRVWSSPRSTWTSTCTPRCGRVPPGSC